MSSEYIKKKSRKHKKSKYESEEVISEKPKKKSSKRRSKKTTSEEEYVETPKIADKSIAKLKKNMLDWLDHDDKIKELNAQMKQYKDAKKEKESVIIEMFQQIGLNEKDSLDVHDKDNNFRGRVKRYKAVSKGSLNQDIVKSALMEVIRNEGKVDQLVKKIESKRPIKETYRLKRTKGNGDD